MDLKETTHGLWHITTAKAANPGSVQFGSMNYDNFGELDVSFNAELISLVEEQNQFLCKVAIPLDQLDSFRAIEELLSDVRGNCRQYFFVYNGTARIKLAHKAGVLITPANFTYDDVMKLPSGASLKVTGKFGYYLDVENKRTGVFFKTTDVRVARKTR
jgi:hypothetical protein